MEEKGRTVSADLRVQGLPLEGADFSAFLKDLAACACRSATLFFLYWPFCSGVIAAMYLAIE